MAKINFGNIVADARGKVGGIVHSKNKSGSYTRTKVTPANPRSVAQQQVRGNFAASAQDWSGSLSDADRAQWIAFAGTFPRTNIFGNAVTLNGLNMYLAYAQVMKQLGLAPNPAPPLSPAVSPAVWDSVFGTCTTAALTISETTLSAQDGAYNYIFATKGMAAGRSPTPSDYRFLLAEPDLVATGPIDIFAAWSARFGLPVTGQKIYALIATADSNSGALSTDQPVMGTVA